MRRVERVSFRVKLVVHLPLLALVALLLACPATPPVEAPEPLPPLAQVPKEYWVDAEGTVSLDEMTVPGRLRMHYVVYDDGRVVVPVFVARMDDLDLVVRLLWWEVEREPLRCTSFRNRTALEGSLDGDELEISAGAKLSGVSYLKRSEGVCVGEARKIEVGTPEDMTATHDPDNDFFALAASFETGDPGEEITISIVVEGQYLNRPPVAVLTASGDDVPLGEDGCPMLRKGDPPIVQANTPAGLEVMLHSNSHDPDGIWPGEEGPKALRVDLSFEQWTRTKGEAFSFLGEGRDLGPVLFETGIEHQLLLWVTDRRGAEARKLCRFEVIPQG